MYMETNNLICKHFGHNFKSVVNYEREPLNGDDVKSILNGIRQATNFPDVERNLQNNINLYKEKSQHVITYCKRCGLTLEF